MRETQPLEREGGSPRKQRARKEEPHPVGISLAQSPADASPHEG